MTFLILGLGLSYAMPVQDPLTQPVPQEGVFVQGSGEIDFIQSLSSNNNQNLDQNQIFSHDGGVGATNANISETNSGGQQPGQPVFQDSSFSAKAIYTGPLSLPELGVAVDAPYNRELGATERLDESHQATAAAHALQSYEYTGSQATSFGLMLMLDGIISGDSGDFVVADILIGNSDYNPEDPFGELGPVSAIASASLFVAADPFDAQPQSFLESTIVNFDVNPGDTFWVDLDLFAIASNSVGNSSHTGGFVDAMNTLSLSFTNGPTNFLKAGLSAPTMAPVPLPAALPLMGAGFAALGFVSWRRKRKAA